MTARSDGIEELALPDLERRMANTVRDGTIMAVDLAKRRVRVRSGSIETTWLPWPAGRAGAGKRRWDPPEVGEQVVMISPGGDLRQARVIPGVYQDAHDAPSSDGNKDMVAYGDGTVIEYDRGSHTLLADLGPAKIHADRTKIELTMGGVVFRLSGGKVTIVGDIEHHGAFASTGSSFTHNSKNVGSTHVHGGVVTGGANTSGPA